MRPKHYISVAFMTALIVAGVALAAHDLTAPSAGIDYCAAVKEQTCKVVGQGEFVIVTSGTRTYVVYLDKGKVIFVEQK